MTLLIMPLCKLSRYVVILALMTTNDLMWQNIKPLFVNIWYAAPCGAATGIFLTLGEYLFFVQRKALYLNNVGMKLSLKQDSRTTKH